MLEGDEDNRIVCNKCKQVVELEAFYSSTFNYLPGQLQSSGASGWAVPIGVPARIKTTHGQGLDASNHQLMKRIGLTGKNGGRFFLPRQITETFATLKRLHPNISLDNKITNTCMALAWTQILIAKLFNDPTVQDEPDGINFTLTAEEKVELYALIAFWILHLHPQNGSSEEDHQPPIRQLSTNAVTLSQSFTVQMQSTNANTLTAHESVASFFHGPGTHKNAYNHGMAKLNELDSGGVLILNHNSNPGGLITILSVQGLGTYIITVGNYFIVANNATEALVYLHAIAEYSLFYNLPGAVLSYIIGLGASTPFSALATYFGGLPLGGIVANFFGIAAAVLAHYGRVRIVNNLDKCDTDHKEEGRKDKMD